MTRSVATGRLARQPRVGTIPKQCMPRDRQVPPLPGPRASVGDEADLVRRLRAGEDAAFADLLRAHRGAIREVVRRYAADADELDEIVQQTFVRAHSALGAFRAESTLRTWLHRIAVNTANEHARARKRAGGPTLDQVDLITNSLGTTRMALREGRRRLAQAIEALPPKQRKVVELRLFNDLPFGAIGAIVGCSEDSAKMNFQHAVKRLKEALGEGA
jgi:RNA polymerase sigma-70 factor (ECF subfamily)